MSSTSTVRRFGTGKTYGRARESTASRAFDEVLTGKPTPIKATPSYTKWGKTNFVAIRGDQKNKLDVIPDAGVKIEPVKESKEEDPFSFDTEDKRKSSPTKRVVVAQEVHRPTTKLPASRIVTVSDGNQNVSNQSLPAAIARPGRTYTRSQEGRTWTGLSGRSQLIMDQFVEVGKTVTTEEGMKVIYYSSQPHPRATPCTPVPVSHPTESLSNSSVDTSAVSSAEAVTPVSLASMHDNTPKAGSSIDDGSDDDDDDIFPATFRRQPLKTYTGEIITPVINAPDSPPPSKKRRMRSSRGRRNSRYTDPSLIEEYRRRYEATNAHKDHTAGMFNSTVISSKEMRNQQGTTLVVVCKPKVDVAEKKDDVQTKYFKNVKKELDKADKNSILDFSESSDSQDETKIEGIHEGKNLQTSLKRASSAPLPSLITSSPDNASSANTPTRNLRVRFADEVVVSSANPKSSVPSTSKRGRPAKSSKDTGSSSQDAASAGTISESGKVQTDNQDASVGMRTRSSNRQYRIFKSRGPPPVSTVSNEQSVSESADSPEMPQLTPELPSCDEGSEDNKRMVEDQTPPDIKNENEEEMKTCRSEEEERSIDSKQITLEESDRNGVEKSGTDETLNQKNKPEMASPMEISEDSQELPQDLTPPVEGNQKEETAAPSTTRRFFKTKKSAGAVTSNLQRRVFEKSPSKASYNARSWHQDQDSPDKEERKAPRTLKPMAVDDFEDAIHSSQTMPKLKRTVHWSKDEDRDSYTSLHVNKQHKELYTVVHNVKQAYEVQESGETQDFMDDIEYLLDSLRDDQPSSIRTLSTIQLAGRCILPSFRMHLRAHGTVTKIFSLLHDACSDPALALSTAAMMFMLSRDRLNMDLDKESLHLMLKLNEVDMPRAIAKPVPETADAGEENISVTTGINGEESVELEKCRRRVQELLEQLQRETNAKQIDLDFVSTGNLAMESLLSLTSRRAGEWFKEELRCLGGLDHFVETIYRCGAEIKEDVIRQLEPYMNNLKKLDRCLRVLENITFMNSDNQTYLIAYNNGRLISSTYRILKLCQQCLPTCPLQESGDARKLKEQPGWTIFSCLLAILRVLVNITHDNEFGSAKVGEEKGLLQTVLSCMLSAQWYIPSDQRFDLLVLSLGLVVNLLEHCDKNRHQLTEMFVPARAKEDAAAVEMNVIEALAQLFLQREAAAAQMEETSDMVNTGEAVVREQMQEKVELASRSPEPPTAGSSSDKQIDGASILEDEETFTKALHKAGKHMENSIVASYVGLLLGCFIQGNEKYIELVKQHLPGGSFQPMICILKKFLGFMELTTAVGTTDGNSISRVIETLEAC